MINLAEFKYFCCMCDVEVGSIIIGWLEIVFGVGLMVGAVVFAKCFEIYSKLNDFEVAVIASAGIIRFCVGIILLHSIQENKRRFIRIYVVVGLLNTISIFAVGAMFGILQMISVDPIRGLYVIICFNSTAVFFFYLVCIVYSYERKIPAIGGRRET